MENYLSELLHLICERKWCGMNEVTCNDLLASACRGLDNINDHLHRLWRYFFQASALTIKSIRHFILAFRGLILQTLVIYWHVHSACGHDSVC